MIGTFEQIDSGKLVCPQTHQRLRVAGAGRLVTVDGTHAYRLNGTVPILLVDDERQLEHQMDHGGSMHAEYSARGRTTSLQRVVRWLGAVGGDHRTRASAAAFQAVVGNQPADALCISVGGGPNRVHPNLVNVNLAQVENVDVVADAYALPYATGSVDAIHCEAVLEHLETPAQAVAEMHRVLRPGGELFAATPFLQAFHAYPSHFQNFTVIGHNRLFERAGFEVRSSGTCVGPTFALTDLASHYLRSYVPTRLASRGMWALTRVLFLPFRLLDRWIETSPDSHLMASTVYAHLRKP